MNTSEILNKAADLIEERGWRRGPGGWDDANGLCLEGGIAAALGISCEGKERMGLYACGAYWAVADYLALNPTPRVCPISEALWQWNDAPGRTAETVIATLRAAAVIEAAKENPAPIMHEPTDAPTPPEVTVPREDFDRIAGKYGLDVEADDGAAYITLDGTVFKAALAEVTA